MAQTTSEHPSAETVGSVLLFTGLSHEEHERLAAISFVEELPAGSRIFSEGDPPDDLWVMLEGRVALTMKTFGQPDKNVLTLRAGELLGWSALIGRKRVASADAVLDTRLLRMPRSELLELCESDHHVGYAVMRQAFEEMADRLLATRLQLLDIFGKPGT